MPTARSLVAFSLAVLIAASSVRADQQHIVAPAQVAAAVADRVAQQDADRAAVADALKRPEVREFATRMGVDLSTVDARISTLAGADLQQAPMRRGRSTATWWAGRHRSPSARRHSSSSCCCSSCSSSRW
jgi:predicted outer membrane protein